MDRYCLGQVKKFRLEDWPTDDKSLCPDGKDASLKLLAEIKAELYDLQVKLHAEKKHRLLVILQGMDTAGKDGTIRHVFGGLDPQGVHVATFGKPTALELSHDYLWRIYQAVPSLGEIVIFNRSQYEDVLAVRVRHLKPPEVWKKRFDHINDFERMLTDEGVSIVKIFLHISHEEQRQRLLKRKNDPRKQWKLMPEDVKDRDLWPSYVEAYEDAIARTSTKYAPWHIIPADRKWYRNVAVANLIRGTLADLKPEFPKPGFDVSAIDI